MTIKKLLIANRGEIAIRIARACAELGIISVAVFPEDDQQCLHTRKADEAILLTGTGAKAYLDGAHILALAQAHGCDAIHPGYGFLSENAEFAQACEMAGINFVGPCVATLNLFGAKSSARQLAQTCEVPLPAGTQGTTSLQEVELFWDSLGSNAAVMIKAIAGGGGRGMRPVFKREDLAAAYERCESEAIAAFGSGDLYVEQLVRHARHIEVQIIGDGQGNVVHVGERECSLQRRQQKVIEVAPSPSLTPDLRQKLYDAALVLAHHCNYRSLGTVEFLVNSDPLNETDEFFFIETNPRVQVEHTVTEMVSGLDLVIVQLKIAGGSTLSELGLTQESIGAPQGYAVQLRINMETVNGQGETQPTGGTLNTFELPSGPGIRVDSLGYSGYPTSLHYDSLLAKVIVHSQSNHFADAINKAARSLRECHIRGVDTNIGLLLQLLKTDAIIVNDIYTRYLDDNLSDLLVALEQASHTPLYFESSNVDHPEHLSNTDKGAPDSCQAIRTSMQGVMVEVSVTKGDRVLAGQQVAVIESMKMEHVLTAHVGGIVQRIDQQAGDGLQRNQVILYIEPLDGLTSASSEIQTVAIDYIRPDLQELIDRQAKLQDIARPEAMAKLHDRGRRSARENIEDLIDEGTFLEFGGLAVAAQRRRRSMDDLVKNTPADGLVTGLASVNGDIFGLEGQRSRCAVLSYDYSVLAGTQGYYNHHKTDRILELALEQQLPVIFFCEGGGGRPGDVDFPDIIGLSVSSFTTMAKLSGLVPTVGIASGRCFAGNAAFLGCHNVIIATEDANVGMAGPAMIEGGGLGSFRPEDVGPMDVQTDNGVVDILVKDDAEAVHVAKQYLSYFQGAIKEWTCSDQRRLRHHIPENRLRSYDVRDIIDDLADSNSVLELRPNFGGGIITALIRIEGRPMGLIANNSRHLGGAIDSAAADKTARFMQLCNGFDLPILSLLDTPGFMVGPEAEKQAQVRHFARMFVTGANADIPFLAICLRKGYGLGAQAMAAGSFKDPFFIISWPTGEFGPMGLEGEVRLGHKKQLEAIEDPAEQKALFDDLVAKAYERGKAVHAASTLDLDNVIDPADTRNWVVQGLKCSKPIASRKGKKVPFVDTW